MGKGSTRRPCDEKKVAANWELVFGPKAPKTPAVPPRDPPEPHSTPALPEGRPE